MKNKEVYSLLKFVDASPTPYHAVQNIAKELCKNGTEELKENESWHCEVGKS